MQFKALTYLALLSFMSFSCFASVSPKLNTKVRIAISSAPSNISFYYGSDANSQNINRLVHTSLTDFDKNMTFYCRLCLSFTEKMKGKKHLINFKLKKDIKFWDGSIVKAQDVYNSWQYIAKNSKIKSIYEQGFKKIEEIIIKNDLK